MSSWYVAGLLGMAGGCIALVACCWRVFGLRLERSARHYEEAALRLEEQRQRLLVAAPLMHKQKLDSLVTLAAGVAHEINNPIHGILNYVELLKRGSIPDQERAFAEEIEREAKRVAQIVRYLLYFGRAGDAPAVAVDVRELVNDTLVLLRGPLLDAEITLDVKVDDEVSDIVCSIQQLQEILLNLVTNARDALNRRNPARTERKLVEIRVRPLRSPADWIRFEVTDTGDGFDVETAERVFDPFFTTKRDGTGLGLSISHGIARAHGGVMSCDSEPGKRTTFRLDLPRTRVSRSVPCESGAFGKVSDKRDVG